jgi:hypothetical protein
MQSHGDPSTGCATDGRLARTLPNVASRWRYLAGADDGGVLDVAAPVDGGLVSVSGGVGVRDGAGPLITSKSKLLRAMGTSLVGRPLLPWRTVAWGGPKNTKAA